MSCTVITIWRRIVTFLLVDSHSITSSAIKHTLVHSAWRKFVSNMATPGEVLSSHWGFFFQLAKINPWFLLPMQMHPREKSEKGIWTMKKKTLMMRKRMMNKTQKGYWIFFMDCVRAGHRCMWQCLLMGHCIQLSATLFKFIFFLIFVCRAERWDFWSEWNCLPLYLNRWPPELFAESDRRISPVPVLFFCFPSSSSPLEFSVKVLWFLWSVNGARVLKNL